MEGFNQCRPSSQDAVQQRRRHHVFLSLGALLFAIGASVFFTQRKKERITRLSNEETEGFKQYRPSSSQDTVQHKRKYHVFLSFRGPDIRKSLVDHLIQSLKIAGFRVFLDSESLERGKNIGISLEDAIRDSTVHIPIFSKNYAESVWCLRELSLIWNCNYNYPETTTIPLFYNVQPSVVRYQKESYAEAFKKHSAKGRYSQKEIDEWKKALRNVCNLSGWSLLDTTNGYEGKLVKHVVMDLLQTLKSNEVRVAKHQVGLSGPMEKVKKLLEMDNHIRVTVGIWGMGGLGKTTLSKALYNNVCHQFEASCFVSNIRDRARESDQGLATLQRRILRDLADVDKELDNIDEGITQMAAHLASKKVLVILDDVDDVIQLDALNGDSYGPGSKIIVTTRDKKVLQLGKIDNKKIHPMEGLSEDEGVQLFSWHAFLRDCPGRGYEGITKKIVNACQGLPLSLEIVGAHLYNERRMGIWSEALSKIDEKVYPSLKISYDALGHEAKQMFLDIACFFVGISSEYLYETLTFYHDFWKALGCETVQTSLASLEEKSLIRIEDSGSYCRFWMHDHLRDLGRQIVKDESPHDPSKRSRLWCKDDIRSVLQHTEEMPNVRGLMMTELKLHEMDNVALMHNLKFLFCWRLNLKREIKMLPTDLRYLVFSYCNNMIDRLDPPSGKLLSLPKAEDRPIKLETLHVSYCYGRAPLPELNWMQSLRELTISECTNLEKLPLLPESLVHIKVESCYNLQKLSSMSHMQSLTELTLHSCGDLKELPPLPESLVDVKVTRCGKLQRLSSMIKLETLHVSECSSLSELNSMKSLKELTLSYCRSLKELPPLLESLVCIKVKSCGSLKKLSMSQMIKLKTLHVSECHSLAELPELNRVQALRELMLSECENLEELPPLPESLVHVKVERCRRVQKLSSTSHMIKLETLHVFTCIHFAQLQLNWMPSLKELTLHFCGNLEELPPLPESLLHIKVTSCGKLKKLTRMSHMIKLETLHVSECYCLAQLPKLISMQSLRELTLVLCRTLEELPLLPESLVHIKVESCSRLQKLSSMSHMIKLETLHVFHCIDLAQLPELKWMQSLRELTLSHCKNLKHLPPLPKCLLKLTLDGCENLKELPPLPEGLINLSTQGCDQLRINVSQPSTRDKGKRMTSEPNNERDTSGLRYFPKRSSTMESSTCFSVQNFFMEQGESSVPPAADPDYEISHHVDTALCLALPVPESPPMT